MKAWRGEALTPHGEPPAPLGPAGASDPTATAAGALALRKAAAFDDLAQWLAEQAGAAHYSDAMDPAWVLSMLKGRLGDMLEDGRDFRAGRRRPAWLRRTGW